MSTTGTRNPSVLLHKLVWEDPIIRSGRASTKRDELLKFRDQLRDNPGRWAVIGVYNTIQSASAAKSYLQSQSKLFPKEEFELTARTYEKGGKLYARYIGEQHN